ncbi:hypothetical protein [Burkholderia sp. GS2Y]|uniref:Uncharacterized protein n=1 Tax=Burkholderia theae TaxID=3143496 RepID=A0ABU9WPR4_9BURK
MQHTIEQAFARGGTIRATRKVPKWSQNEPAGRGADRETPHD